MQGFDLPQHSQVYELSIIIDTSRALWHSSGLLNLYQIDGQSTV